GAVRAVGLGLHVVFCHGISCWRFPGAIGVRYFLFSCRSRFFRLFRVFWTTAVLRTFRFPTCIIAWWCRLGCLIVSYSYRLRVLEWGSNPAYVLRHLDILHRFVISAL